MDVKKELEKLKVINVGHFVGTSGNHLAGYSNGDRLFPHIDVVKRITEELVKPFAKDNIETVVVPAVGAIPLSQWGPYQLEKMTGKTVKGVWADKIKPKGFIFERDTFADMVKDKRVLILEDNINTMYSVKMLIDLIKKTGGDIIGVSTITANKGASAEALGVPKYVKLADAIYEAWSPEDCAKNGLCAQKTPIVTNMGHGDEYQAEHPDYAGGYISV